jgi:hypothetical protein
LAATSSGILVTSPAGTHSSHTRRQSWLGRRGSDRKRGEGGERGGGERGGGARRKERRMRRRKRRKRRRRRRADEREDENKRRRWMGEKNM